MEGGANVNWKDREYGSTGLHQASRLGHDSIIRCLIVNGANIDEKDDVNGKTPLMYAAVAGQIDPIKTLLLSGADYKMEDKRGMTALSITTDHTDVRSVLE